MNRVFGAAAAAALLCTVVGSGAGYALPLTGEIWVNVVNSTDANDPANFTGPDHANFNPGAINYNSDTTGYTPAQFLNGPPGGFFGVAGAFNPNGSLNNSVLKITGTIGLNAGNNAFILGHDDGAILDIAGIVGAANPACTGVNAGAVLCQPGPSGFVATPFNVNNPGAAGNFDFTLFYNECCGPPAVLEFAVNNIVVGTPEPASLAVLGSALLGLGLLFIRRRRNL